MNARSGEDRAFDTPCYRSPVTVGETASGAGGDHCNRRHSHM